MRLEQEDRRRAEHLLAGLVAMRLGDDAGVLGEVGHRRMVVVVGVLLAVGQHEGGVDGAVDIGQAEQAVLRQGDRIVAEVPELDVVHAEHGGRGARPPSAARAFTRSSVMPGWRQSFADFAALAIGQADDGDLPAARGMQRDGAAGAPDEIGGMGADDEGGA